MSRGVSFERVLDFFDHAPLRVAQAAITQGYKIVGDREEAANKSAKRQAAAVSVSRGPKKSHHKKVAPGVGLAGAPSNQQEASAGHQESLADA